MPQESEEGICPYPDTRDRLWGDLHCYELAEEKLAEAIVVRGYEPLIEIVEFSQTDEGYNPVSSTGQAVR